MELVSYTRSFWAALFTLTGSGSISFEGGRWSVCHGPHTESIEAKAVTEVHVRPGLFWSTLELVTGGDVVQFGGLDHQAADHLQGVFSVAAIPGRVAEALATWEAAGARRYLNHFTWAGWRARQAGTRELLRDAELRWLGAEARAGATRFIETFDKTEAVAGKLNQEHLERELRECKALLDSVETNPLTARQRRAILTDEDNTLVVAGAGTGKTSIVVGKVAYIVRRLGVRPADVLLLAYNTAAADELQERVSARVGGVDLKVSTFHALGQGIIAQVEGKKPSLSRLVDSSDGLKQFIEKTLRAMLTLDRWRTVLVRHLCEHLRPYKSAADFINKNAYIQWLKRADVKSMRGDQVRSLEECVIADWLFLNGIEYVYERDYEHDVATKEHRQYRPDFYLVESGVYIEHFGIDRDGNTAPHIPAAAYRAGMEWKRATHKRFGTRLMETFSYDKKEGVLTDRLAERLAAVGVLPKPIPAVEIERAADGRGVISLLAHLLSTFLQHFKEGRRSLSELRPLTGAADPQRARSFLGVFEHIYEVYEGALREEKAIDFQDMIGRAADHVESGRYRSAYRYVVVDEFQDTSRGRARLLRALLDQVPDRRLTCVGDDWQSIYRFAGSDIAHMTQFSTHFGHTASVSLDESFRFGRRLLQASAQFVQKNPAQLRKTLTSARDEGRPAVVIVPMSKAPAEAEGGATLATTLDVRGVLTRIAQQMPEGGTVYLLGRYNFSLRGADLATLCGGFDKLKIEFQTVHRSKGLQADFVILLDASAGRYGFPSELEDDPLLSMVLAEPDALEHAEERRLFYVALTRAKRGVFILTPETRRSAFVEELLGKEYTGLVEGPLGWADRVPCPDCGGSLVRRANGKTGEPFWGCVNYPDCGGSARVCAVCQEGALVLQGSVYQCSRRDCAGQEEVCPECRVGMLRKKRNRTQGTEFWACSKWKPDKTGCNYTRNVDGGGQRRG